MALKEYNVGDYLYYNDSQGYPDGGKILRRYSINPGGPLTYYDVECGPITQVVHISQVVDYKPASPVKSIREEVLDEAKRIVTKDRNTNYGSPENNFKDIAEMWTTYSGHTFKAHDVAAMMIMVKLSRIKTSPGVQDHWIDMAGYSSCGAQAYAVTMQAKDPDVHP